LEKHGERRNCSFLLVHVWSLTCGLVNMELTAVIVDVVSLYPLNTQRKRLMNTKTRPARMALRWTNYTGSPSGRQSRILEGKRILQNAWSINTCIASRIGPFSTTRWFGNWRETGANNYFPPWTSLMLENLAYCTREDWGCVQFQQFTLAVKGCVDNSWR
jgi:hypothetical protein